MCEAIPNIPSIHIVKGVQGDRDIAAACRRNDMQYLREHVGPWNVNYEFQVIGGCHGQIEAVSLLGYAVFYKKYELAQFCVDVGADVNMRGTYSNSTPLAYAVSMENLDMIGFLLAHGADVNTMSDGRTPLDIVLNKKNPNYQICELLIAMGGTRYRHGNPKTSSALNLPLSLQRLCHWKSWVASKRVIFSKL